MPHLKCVVAAYLLCAPVFAVRVDKRISPYAHTVWRIQDGMFSEPRTITQPVEGYIWNCIVLGVLRFAGIRFNPWVTAGGEHLQSATIESLRGARDGSLWIGTNFVGLKQWNLALLLEWGEKLVRTSRVASKLAEVGESRSLDSSAFGEAYRIGREASINAFSQSQSASIVQIRYDRANFCIRVRNNEIGVDPNILKDGCRGHWGPSGIRGRAKHIGTKSDIWGSLITGTEIDLKSSAKGEYSRGPKAGSWFRIQRTVDGGKAK